MVHINLEGKFYSEGRK